MFRNLGHKPGQNRRQKPHFEHFWALAPDVARIMKINILKAILGISGLVFLVMYVVFASQWPRVATLVHILVIGSQPWTVSPQPRA